MNGGMNLSNFIASKPVSYFVLLIMIGIKILLLLLIGFLIYYIIHIGNKHVENKNKIRIKKKYFLIFFIGILLFLLLVMVYKYRSFLWKILMPVLWAIVLAYLLNPIVQKIEKRGFSRLWSVALIYISMAVIVLFFSFTLIPKMIEEIKKLVELLPSYTQQTSQYINALYRRIEKLDHFSPQLAAIKEPIQENIIKIQHHMVHGIENMTRGILNLFSQVINLILILIFSFYFLKDADYFKKKIIFIIPKAFRNEIMNMARDIDRLLNKFIRGQLIVALCVGILSTIALLMIRVDFAFLIGAIAGLFDIIPYIGPIIGAIPGVAFALLDEPSKAIWVIIAFTIVQQIESAVISPKIVGESVGLHPVLVILTLIIGNEIAGIIGMLFAVPTAASIKIIGRYIVNWIVKI